jgi:predicted outer membrane protein
MIGDLATQLSANGDVRTFGQTLSSDRADAIIAAQEALKVDGLTMPQLSVADEQTIQQLATLNQQQFDVQFLTLLTQQLQADIASTQKEIQTGLDLAIRSYAAGQLPTLKGELQFAEQLLTQLQGTASGS